MINEEMGGPAMAGSMPESSALEQGQTWSRPRRSRSILRFSPGQALAVAIAGMVALYVLILLTAPESAIPLGWMFFIAGLVLLFCGTCWQTYVALREETQCAVLSILFFPIYPVYFALTRWKAARLPFLTAAGGAAMCAGSVSAILLASWLIYEREHPGEIADATDTNVPSARATQTSETPASSPQLAGPASNVPGQTPGVGPAQPGAGQQAQANPNEDIPPATDLLTTEAPKYVTPQGGVPPQPGMPVAAPAAVGPPVPPPDPTLSPLERAFEDASRAYVARLAVDLVAGEEQAMDRRMRWIPYTKRACMGLRWGLGVRAAAAPGPPATTPAAEVEKLIGPVSLALVSGLEKRIMLEQFGNWPEGVDPRFRQVSILKTGRQEELLAAARRRGLDLIVAVDATPASAPAPQPAGPQPPAPQPSGPIQVQLIDVIEEKAIQTWQPAVGGAPGSDLATVMAAEVFKFVDDNLVLQSVPWLIVEPVKARLDTVPPLMPKLGNAANVLVEIRFYQNKKFLSPDKAAPLYNAILGAGRGDVIASGDAAARREVLEAWLKGL